MANIQINKLEDQNFSDIEIVERKGLGHPDTICDAVAEKFSRALSKAYKEKFGLVLHHNVDKALLVGGRAKPKFQGGKILQPIHFYIAGRATSEYKGKKLDTRSIFEKSANEWLKENIPNLDLNEHIKLYFEVKPGSQDLVELFERFQLSKEIPLANDTSFGVGFSPLSETETIVYNLEKYLNSKSFKNGHKFLGEDIKIMATSNKEGTSLTIAAAFIDKQVRSLDDYFDKKQVLKTEVSKWIEKNFGKQVNIDINMADSYSRESVYITVTGTSAEAGDDGQVGRGNRVNGLITPYRPMSLEAAAGKNPVSHVGKIYNVTANAIAERISREIAEIEETYCYLVSQIGKPITEPKVIDVRIKTKSEIKSIQDKIEQIAQDEIQKTPKLWMEFLNGGTEVY